MSVQEWCDFNRLPLHQYYYWKRRLATTSETSANPGFLTFEVLDPAPLKNATGGVTIRIAGALIEVAADFDPDRLRQVVRALATESC